MDKKTIIGVGVFVLVSAGIIFTVLPEDQENLYACYANNETVVGLCFKLSAVNEEGLQTRCYYNESSPRKYKICNTGWKPYEYVEFEGEEINLTDYTHHKLDFLNFSEYVITEVRCGETTCDKVWIEIYGKKKTYFVPNPKKTICEIDELNQTLCETFDKSIDDFDEEIRAFEARYLARVELRKEINKVIESEKQLIIAKQTKLK